MGCEKCGSHCSYCTCKPRYRYTCPECLSTFIDTEYSEEFCCWECGEDMVVTPKKDHVYNSHHKIDIKQSDKIMTQLSKIFQKNNKFPYELIDSFNWIVGVVKKEIIKEENDL